MNTGSPITVKNMKLDPLLPHLPHDIICSGIFTRLPTKSLCRFKCVNKLWYTTITDPDFAKSRSLPKSTVSPILALYQYRAKDNPNAQVFNFITQDNRHLFKFETCVTANFTTCLIGHCNACFRCQQHIALFNPCTGQCLSRPLPPPPLSHSYPHPPSPPLGISYGFGFDPSTNEYKVVQIMLSGHKLYRCMVFTFGAKGNSWRDVTTPLDLSHHLKWRSLPSSQGAPQNVNRGRPLHVNATLFWYFPDPHLFMVFDLHSEDFRLFHGPMPEPDLWAFSLRPSDCCFLIEWQGSICLAFQNYDGDIVHLYVYNSSNLDADGWHVKQVEFKIISRDRFLRHGALGDDSILYCFGSEGLVLYAEGLDGCFHDLAGSELATKFAFPSGFPQTTWELEYGFEYLFTYHVENQFSLKSMLQ